MKDLVLDTDKADMVLIVTRQPLKTWLSIQLNAEAGGGKTTSIHLTLDQAGHLINAYWPESLPTFQEWRARYEN